MIVTLDTKSLSEGMCGLKLDKSLPFDCWIAVGREMVKAGDRLQFAIGDWINFGEDNYGSRYDLAVRSMPMEYTTLRNIASVCRHVPLSLRNDKLLWSHHVVVSVLHKTPAKIKKYLDLAAESTPRMSVAELRQLIREKEKDLLYRDEESPAKSVSDGFFRVVSESIIEAKHAIEDAPKWTKQRRDKLRPDIKAAAEAWAKLAEVI